MPRDKNRASWLRLDNITKPAPKIAARNGYSRMLNGGVTG